MAPPLNERLRGTLIYLGDLHMIGCGAGQATGFEGIYSHCRVIPISDDMARALTGCLRIFLINTGRCIDVYGFSLDHPFMRFFGVSRGPMLRTDDMAVIYHGQDRLDYIHW